MRMDTKIIIGVSGIAERFSGEAMSKERRVKMLIYAVFGVCYTPSFIL